MVEKRFCDRCGAEIPPGAQRYSLEFYNVTADKIVWDQDLCEKCGKGKLEWL
jgi:hypothetical protein